MDIGQRKGEDILHVFHAMYVDTSFQKVDSTLRFFSKLFEM